MLQTVDLFLLTEHRLVQGFQRILGKRQLHFQFGDARFYQSGSCMLDWATGWASMATRVSGVSRLMRPNAPLR